MRYENVSCSQCGRSFGPGDHGFSHCENHPGYVQDMKDWQERLLKVSGMILGEANEMDYRLDDPRVLAQTLRYNIDELRDIVREMDPPRKRSKKNG
jgi:hypothetical protein